MSTQPLLPSYDYATRQLHREQQLARGQKPVPSTQEIVNTLCFLTFSSNCIVSTLWACQSRDTSNADPPTQAPLLPYIASLCLLMTFCVWVAYLVFISRHRTLQRTITVWTSILGKLVLAGMHAVVWYGYKRKYADLLQPNWLVVFLTAQAWWDLLVFIVACCLQGARNA